MNITSESSSYKSITLNDRLICDLEMILNGAFNPLNGFLNKENYDSVVNNMRLVSGELWPIPIVLYVNNDLLKDEKHITLKDKTGLPLAIIDVEDFWKPDIDLECEKCYGTTDDNHPYVNILKSLGDLWYIGGNIREINKPKHFDFTEFRMDTNTVKNFFKNNNWNNIIGFQTRNPMHRSHFELTKYAMKETKCDDIKLFLSPVVGVTQDCDVDYHLRVRCYKKLMDKYEEGTAMLCLLPLSMRMAGPREAVWHALIRKNYGCNYFIVGRDHAGPSYKKKDGKDFYGPYDAHKLLEDVSEEIGIKIILSKMIVYVKEIEGYLPDNEVKDGMTVMNISGTEQRRLLKNNLPIPEWFSFPEIADELKKDFDVKKGLCLYFVGLSGSGKSTIAEAIKGKFLENEHRKITVLDGDVVRLELSKGLGFTKDDRSVNVRRIGYVASEIVKHGGIVLCANIAPYEEDRKVNRERIRAVGDYVEIWVNTSVDKCEERDVKGLYKLAKEGKIKQFTGVNDPFEEPVNADIILNGGEGSIEENVDKIMLYLQNKNLL